jgi:hypothetical protein
MLSLDLGEPLHDGSRECDPKVVSGSLEVKYLSERFDPSRFVILSTLNGAQAVERL